jgi:hypothetical protein
MRFIQEKSNIKYFSKQIRKTIIRNTNIVSKMLLNKWTVKKYNVNYLTLLIIISISINNICYVFTDMQISKKYLS